MVLSTAQKMYYIEKNRREYGPAYDSIRFITEEHATAATQERDELAASLRETAVFCCNDTKLDGRRLSRGCEICTQGDWSCLFVNGRCNCRCFYCPAQQDEIDVPTTNTVPFPTVTDYVDYIKKLGFTGVSLSGGEPLLTLDKTLEFLRAVKRACGESVYTWLYTNGTLAGRETLLKLKQAGLNEIRFDIGATGLKLDVAKAAVEWIDVVTVEIPAVPEEEEALKSKMVEMEEAGIQHLNLHQLRLTQHNLPRLTQRGYTFLHGERVTVLESELTALRLIRWAQHHRLSLPINYCSFVYKNRYQRAFARRKSASYICKPHEGITDNGYIRWLEVAGTPAGIQRQIERFHQHRFDPQLWLLSSNRDRIVAAPILWPAIDSENARISVAYADAAILPAVTYRNVFVELPLNPNRSLYIEKRAASEKLPLDTDQFDRLQRCVASHDRRLSEPDLGPVWDRVKGYEWIEPGLAEYF